MRARITFLWSVCAFVSIPVLHAQDSSNSTSSSNTKSWTTQDDHRNMMEQLGITKLRPGPSGNPQAPNSANYDESIANPFPDLPAVLQLKNGDPVDSKDMWWSKRRPEIVEDFEREVLGRIPANVPKVIWKVEQSRENKIGEIDVVEKHIVGHVDNASFPDLDVKISMSLTLPNKTTGPMPVLMMFGGTPFDPPPQFGRGRGAAGGSPGGQQPAPPQTNNVQPGAAPEAASGVNNPAGQGTRAAGVAGGGQRAGGGFGIFGQRNQQILEGGWGYAMISPNSIQADNGAGLTKGIIGLTNQGKPRKPDDWGTLRAWAWGASRGLDYLESEPMVNAKRVGIEGVSRYGKAALVTMAFDTRFAMVLVGSSGEGGAKLHRRNFGEAVENLTGSGEYHWMAGNFLKYGAAEASFGSKNAGDIPVDAHQLIALCAPRLTFISYGVPEKGDAKWLDQQGSYMAAIAAGPVFRLLGAKDLGKSDDYKSEKMPDVNVGLLEGELAWRQHDGGHTDGPNMVHFVRWANEMFAKSSSTR